MAASIGNAGTVIATGQTTINVPTFTNSTGKIDLTHGGVTTNQLTVSGNYVGQTGSVLYLNVDPLHQVANQLIITGNASGNTIVTANYLSSNKVLTTPIPIVQSGAGSTATFTLVNNPSNGLFNYSVGQSSPGTYSLSTTLSSTGIAAPTISRTATQTSQITISGIETHLQGWRDDIQRHSGSVTQTGRPLGYADDNSLSYQNNSTQQNAATNALAMAVKAPRAAPTVENLGPKPALWIQAFDTWDQRTGSSGGYDFGNKTNTYGFQLGFDETWRNLFSSTDALVVGIVGGTSQARVTYSATDMRVLLNGPGIGLYGAYINGGFSTDAVVKGDWFNMSEDDQAMGISNSVKLQTLSVAENVQYKFNVAKDSFIEPTAGYAYTNTQYGSGAEALGLENGYSVRLQAGARFGTAWNWNNIHLAPTLTVLAYDTVLLTGTALQNAALTGGPTAPTDLGLVRGEVDAEISADFGNGLSGLLRGEVRFGEDLIGEAIKVGLRKQW